MKRILIALSFCICTSSFAQYKNDNVLFKTVDPAELATALKQNPNYLLLDVRSKGEHYDTSAFAHNIGRFKGAYNIDVRELGKRLNEIADYKDRPVFVYCSHSQRSRRASKMLADSGFTKVFNINGGMTAFHYTDLKNKDGIKEIWETSDAYNIISPQQLCNALKDQNVKIIDVRTDSAYNHITADAKLNSLGTFKKAEHISLADLSSRINDLKKDQQIILIDPFGGDAVKAAQLLTQNGFQNVSVLLEGIDRWLLSDPQNISCKTEYVSPVQFKIISPFELGRWKESFVALDVRSSNEFHNKHADAFRNIGSLNKAVNIPYDDLDEFSEQLKTYKKMPIVIYDFSGGRNAYAAANMLAQNGFKNVHVLAGGLFNLRWTGANVKGQKNLMKLVEGVPTENL
jgi:rhodanese-related sulfurtransferase